MKDQKGTTLVSVIVSFAVLMVVMLLLQVSISASGRYAARAEEIWKQAAAAENKYMDDEFEPPDGVDVHIVSLKMMCNDGEKESWGHLHIDKTAVSGNDIVFYYASTREYTEP